MDDLFDDIENEDFEDLDDSSFEAVESDADSFDDEFDQLRRKSARTGSTYDDMDMSADDEFGSDSGSGFSLSNFTTSQKLILLALLMLDIVAVGFGVLVLLGRI